MQVFTINDKNYICRYNEITGTFTINDIGGVVIDAHNGDIQYNNEVIAEYCNTKTGWTFTFGLNDRYFTYFHTEYTDFEVALSEAFKFMIYRKIIDDSTSKNQTPEA